MGRLSRQDYTAADEMLDSKWQTTKNRAESNKAKVVLHNPQNMVL